MTENMKKKRDLFADKFAFSGDSIPPDEVARRAFEAGYFEFKSEILKNPDMKTFLVSEAGRDERQALETKITEQRALLKEALIDFELVKEQGAGSHAIDCMIHKLKCALGAEENT